MRILVSEHSNGNLRALNKSLDDNEVVDLVHGFYGAGNLRRALDDIDAKSTSLSCRLHHTLPVHFLSNARRIVRRSALKVCERSCGNTCLKIKQLRLGFVHRRRARPHPRPCVGKPDRL